MLISIKLNKVHIKKNYYISNMKLTKADIKIIEKEFGFKSIFETGFRIYSRMLWNKYKKNIWVTFKDGSFDKADQDGWKF